MRALILATALLGACGGNSKSDEDEGADGGAFSGGSSSGGSAGTGGTSAKGGTGQGGAAGFGNAGALGGNAGGGGEGACGPTLTFELSGPANDGVSWCLGAPQSCGGGQYFSIHDADGQPLQLGLGCSGAACSSCEQLGCTTNCPQSTLLPGDGVSTTWDGTEFVGDVCGANVACQRPACVAPGQYVARFCAYELLGSGAAGATNNDDVLECETDASETETCVDVPFTYPSTETVVGAL
jgi:hypothetical protein